MRTSSFPLIGPGLMAGERSLIVAVLVVWAAAWAAGSQAVGGDATRVAARVLDGTTGEPLRNVMVRLTPGANLTTTDSDGRFVLEGIPPGDYTLHATRVGYMNARLDGRRIPGNDGVPLVLESGDDVQAVLRLFPAAIVSGRILSSSGRPAQGLEVTIFRWTYNDLGEREPLFLGSQTTNDLGEYRFNSLDPGEYGFRVKAGDLGLTEPGSSILRPLYHPGTERRDEAELVLTESGIETRLSDLILPPGRPGGRLRILPVDANGQPVSGVSTVSLFAAGEPGVVRSGTPDPGQPVMTGDLPHGRYDVVLMNSAGIGRTTIDLLGAEADVQIAAFPGRSLTGRVASVGSDDGVPGQVAGVSLEFLDTTSFQTIGRALRISLRSDSDGALRSRSFTQGVAYHVRLSELPADAYPTSITYGGQDVLGSDFYVDPLEEGELEVTLGAGAATVQGSVVGIDGEHVPAAVVALLPDDRSRTHMFRLGVADLEGRYRVGNIGPGAYRLYAWPELDGAAYRNADFMSAYEGLGTPVRIESADTTTVDLTAR